MTEDPEYQEVSKKYFEAEKEIAAYMEANGVAAEAAVAVAEDAAEEAAEVPEDEMITPEMNKYLNKVEDVLEGMGEQMEQLNDMEAFLRATFGDFDPADWEDDEEEENK